MLKLCPSPNPIVTLPRAPVLLADLEIASRGRGWVAHSIPLFLVMRAPSRSGTFIDHDVLASLARLVARFADPLFKSTAIVDAG